MILWQRAYMGKEIMGRKTDYTICTVMPTAKTGKKESHMRARKLTKTMLSAYIAYLREEERSQATIEKYSRDIYRFYNYLGVNAFVNKEGVIAYKRQLSGQYSVASTNSMLVSINGLLKFLCWSDCYVRLFKVQRGFCKDERELISRAEYGRLVEAASQRSQERIGLVMQTICSTGIRVSELPFITVEAVRTGVARVRCKGKERAVLIPQELKKLLLQYCSKREISSGCIFITRSGRPIDRSNIWAAMKKLCQIAKVPESKVFPHNLRHLFALTFYQMKKDLAHLADILGHSSIETTRIYTTTSSTEHRKLLAQMGLVINLRE